MFLCPDTGLPALDTHAHVAPDVTSEQLDALGDVTVFAVTRSLDEAEAVASRRDPQLVWGCGVHPGVRSARDGYDPARLRSLLPSFSLVGEVGLDRRAGHLQEQQGILKSVLRETAAAQVLVSVHSAGCSSEVVDIVTNTEHPGVILHWFLGDDSATRGAVEAGCYFSVNGAMADQAIRRVPLDRMLPETDFPATSRRGGGRRPGDTSGLRQRVAGLLGTGEEDIHRRWYRNLRALAIASGALDRLPAGLADRLVGI